MKRLLVLLVLMVVALPMMGQAVRPMSLDERKALERVEALREVSYGSWVMCGASCVGAAIYAVEYGEVKNVWQADAKRSDLVARNTFIGTAVGCGVVGLVTGILARTGTKKIACSGYDMYIKNRYGGIVIEF